MKTADALAVSLGAARIFIMLWAPSTTGGRHFHGDMIVGPHFVLLPDGSDSPCLRCGHSTQLSHSAHGPQSAHLTHFHSMLFPLAPN